MLCGYNGTIFAYGQTGTGKTYTMFGEVGDSYLQGIIPRTFDYVFNKINAEQLQNQSKYVISLAFVQLYLEVIYDLIEPSNHPNIRETPETGVYIDGVKWIRVSNVSECYELIINAEKNRKTFSTKMNVNSSRSHALLIARIEKVNVDDNDNDNVTDNDSESVLTKSHLFLVDLAGSERVKKSCVKKMRLEEAKKINLSLLELGNCIQALVDNKTRHINYRNSKLTRILKESLGGNAKTTLIVNISPVLKHLDETLSSLNFGLRAMKIQNKPIINNIHNTQLHHTQCIRIQKEYQILQIKYMQLQSEYQTLLDGNGHLTYAELCDSHSTATTKDVMNGDNNTVTIQRLTTDISMLNENANIYKQQSEKIINSLKQQISELKEQIHQMNNAYSTAISEHKALLNTINDYKKQLQHVKNNYMKEKATNEVHASKIESLTCYIKNIESKLANTKSKAVQTESMLTQDTVDILLSLNISNDDLNRNDYKAIISQLILHIDNTMEQTKQYQFKLKQIAKALEDERDKMKNEQEHKNEEIRLCKYKLKTVHEQLNKQNANATTHNNINVDELISPYKVKELQLKQHIVNKDKTISALQLENENLHLRLTELDTSLKTINVNEHSYKAQIKKLEQTITKSEKDLTHVISDIKDDITFFTKYSKRIEKIDFIIDKELLVASSLKDLEHSLNKLKREMNKGIELRNAFLNPEQLHVNSNRNSSLFNLNNCVVQVEQMGDTNREITVIMSGYQSKLIETFMKYVKQHNRFKTQTNVDNEDNGSKYNVNAFMNKFKVHFKTLTQCFKGVNASDLVEQVCNVGVGNDCSSEWMLMVVEKAVEEFSERANAFNEDKELEVELLNEKVEFLLRELSVYRQMRVSFSKSYANSNRNSELNNQLELKIEENNTLNGYIQELQHKNSKLRNEIAIIKNELNNAVMQINKHEMMCLHNKSIRRNYSVDLIHKRKNKK